jgi:hypothetical protein
MMVVVGLVPLAACLHIITAEAAPAALQFPWSTTDAHNIQPPGSGYGCGGHLGLDYYALDFNLLSGTPVAAVFGGIAHTVTSAGGYGNLVWIDHGNGFVSLYAHLQYPFLVSDGQGVVQGQSVAMSDNTGTSSGPHLHFAMHTGATTYYDGNPFMPESLSGYSGFGRYGGCTGLTSPTYTSLRGGLAPNAASNFSGSLGLFIQTNANAYNSQQPLPLPQATWAPWYSTGNGNLIGRVSVAENGNGIIEAFARGSEGKIWHSAQTCVNCSSWTSWMPFAGPVQADPVAITNADGRLEVFAVCVDQTLCHTWETAPGGPWTLSGWNTLGGRIEGVPAVAVNQDGTLEVFVRANSTAIYHQWQSSAGGSWPGSWSLIAGTLFSDPVVGTNQDGTLEILALAGSDDHVVHDRQTAANQHTSLSSWYDIAGSVANVPTVARNLDGTIEIFSMSVDNNHVIHTWQTTTSWTMTWTPHGWDDIIGSLAGIAVAAVDTNGALELFAYGTNQVYWHDYQTTPGGGADHTGWSGWNPLVS